MLRVLLIILSSLSLSAFAQTQYLNLYIWDDYIDPQVLDIFERRYQIKVIVSTYTDDLDRDQVTAASGGEGLDLILVDDSSIRSYIRNQWIVELDRSQLPNWRHLDLKSVLLGRLEQKYVQPYAEGSYGLFYRQDLIPLAVDSWRVLFDPPQALSGKIGLAGQPTELLPSVFLYLGFDLRSPETNHMNEVEDLLMQLRPKVKQFTSHTDELLASFSNGELVVSAGYSSDLKSLREAHEDIQYSIPKEGGFYWLDSLAIAKKSSAKEAAYEFLNFLLEPEIAALQMEYNHALIPHASAINRLPSEIREQLKDTRVQARSLHRFEDPNIWTLRRIMSIWYSLDTEGIRQ